MRPVFWCAAVLPLDRKQTLHTHNINFLSTCPYHFFNNLTTFSPPPVARRRILGYILIYI